MKTYLSDIIPKVKRFSDKLDNISLLMGTHWAVLDDGSDFRMVYIFRESNQLLISTNGRITKGSWEYLGHNSLMIDHNQESYLFQMGFFDKNILALKLDSRDEYALLINQNNDANIVHKINEVHQYLINKYVRSDTYRIANSNQAKISSSIMVQFKTDKGIVIAELPFQDNDIVPGTKVYQNGHPLADGKYKFASLCYVHVKGGVVNKVTVF
jgi:hypothetical protein